jgi:hypothetical protein
VIPVREPSLFDEQYGALSKVPGHQREDPVTPRKATPERLFIPPEKPSHAHDTRREAYEAAKPREPERRLMILNALHSLGGMNSDEIASALRMNLLTVRPTLTGLDHDGLVYRAGDVRPSRSGHNAKVYRITREGLALVATVTHTRPHDHP